MSRDARIAEVTASQYGVISLRQLAACGLSASAARSRLAARRLHRVYRGVYSPGLFLPALGAEAAALLACGPSAVLSHRTAAALHALRLDNRRVIDVTAGRLHGRRQGTIATHSAARLRPVDTTIVGGLPVTSIARTVLDCTPRLGRRGTEKLCQAAVLQQTFDLRAFESVLQHLRGHPGAPKLAGALEDLTRSKGTTVSPPEDALLAAFRAAGLPEPECNAPIELPDGSWIRADFLWRRHRLIVEADPRGTHDRTASYRSDRRRDREARRLGFETARFSDHDIENSAGCAREVHDLLRSMESNQTVASSGESV